jgi:hypothetical protein
MALLKIARMGHPVLRAQAGAVEDPTASWVRRLVEDMVETMEDAGGTGLAAPQVHMPWRIVVFQVGGERLTDLPGDSEQDLTVLINPVIEPVGNEMAYGCPGCAASCRAICGCAIAGSASTAARSSATSPGFTPGSCSMNATISTASSTRSA